MRCFTGGSPEPFTIYEFAVSPYPVLYANGSIVEFSLQIGLNEELPVGSTVQLTVSVVNPSYPSHPDILNCVEVVPGTFIGSWLVFSF